MSTAQMPAVSEQMAALWRGAVEIIQEDELVRKLTASRETGRPLRVKFGVDPTAPDIHLGHTVVLRKLRQFQDLGHQAVLIIGDYTALVGDPSGRSKTRPMLTPEEIAANAQTYIDQAAKVLDCGAGFQPANQFNQQPGKAAPHVEVRRNSEWFAEMSFLEVIQMTAKMTVARTLERDDFSKRYRDGEPIGVHEMLYPLMQGYDSVMVKADVELGGTEQTFNLLVGRDLQRDDGQEPQVCLTMPILPGTDGVRRMSKSLGNYIGVDEPPDEMFGKAMSIPDEVMRDMFMLTTDVKMAEIDRLLADDAHPRDAKVALARRLVEMYHSTEAADAAEAEFNRVFSRCELPSDIPETKIPASKLKDGAIWIVDLMREAGLVGSGSEARRLIAQDGVSIDGGRISDTNAQITIEGPIILKVGKRRFARIKPGS